MKAKNKDTIDEVSLKLKGIIALFDLISTSKVDGVRDVTISEFAFFVMHALEDANEKLVNIDDGNLKV